MGPHSTEQDDPITDAEREEAVRALLTEPDVLLEVFDRAVARGDQAAQRVVRDYLRATSKAFGAIAQWHRAHPHPGD
jgi:hypothetical protein